MIPAELWEVCQESRDEELSLGKSALKKKAGFSQEMGQESHLPAWAAAG